MLLNKITVEGTFSSENSLGVGTTIQLGSRDLGTGEINIIGESKTYVIEGNGGNNSSNNITSSFSIQGDNVKIYEGGKQLILIYNGKYIEVPVFEQNVVGLVGHVSNFYVYDMKTSGDLNNKQEANYIGNTKTTIFDDPLINWYILGSDYSDYDKDPNSGNPLLLSGKDNEELMTYFNELKGDLSESHGVTNLRNLEVESLVKKGKGIKELTNQLFEKTNIEKVLIENGFNKKEIESIRNTGMINNMGIYQEKFKSDWVKREEMNMKKIREGDYKGTDVELLNKKDEIKSNSGKDNSSNQIIKENSIENKDEEINNNDSYIIEKQQEEDSFIKENNHYSLLFGILCLIIMIIGLAIFYLRKRKNKKTKTNINIIKDDSDIN